MHIWLLQIGEALPLSENIRKLRTAILSEKLINKGHSVLWWTSAFDHFKKDWMFHKDTEIEIENGLKIKALKGIGYKKNISISRFIDHRVIAWKFKRLAPIMQKPNIIVASMPSYDMAYNACCFARSNNIPLLVDIRDQWPDIFIHNVPLKVQKLIKFFLAYEFYMIKKVMQNADGLLSMMNDLLEWGLQYTERQKTWKDRVFYLGYQRNISKEDSKRILELFDNGKYEFVVAFIGTFASYHNPSILLDCAKRLKDICFVLAGDGELFSEIKHKASELHNVKLAGWLNQDEITTLVKYSHIGICPSNQVAKFFPNKAFAYLSAGLPVISAFQGDLKEIIEKHQIGLYYPPNDVDALVNCIKKLYYDKMLYKKMSENAGRVFEEMFDADKIYEEYAKHIEEMANEYREVR